MSLSLYENLEIEKEIEAKCIDEEGEIDDHNLAVLVAAQTNSLVQIENLCKYCRHLEGYIELAKEEKKRINENEIRAKKRLDSIKKYLTPYISIKGKLEAGTFKLSLRKSKRIQFQDEEKFKADHPEYCKIEITLDKARVKEDIEKGIEMPDAYLLEYENLQMK